MSQVDIVCKPTADTFVRFGVVMAALFGFAVYFFYDAAVGYREKNEVIYSYQAFAALGQKVMECTPEQWADVVRNKPLIPAEQQEGGLVVLAGEEKYPLPENCAAAISCPPEVQDYVAMSRGWADCWAEYSKRMHFPIKPGEHPYNDGSIREQWVMGGLFIVIGLVLLGFALRTRGRVLALQGDLVTAAGQQFRVADIELIDLRQWGPGFKGAARLTVKGRKIKVDGMTYGGFSKEKGEPAEAFMKALLEQYKGEIIEYEVEEKSDSVG